VTLTRPSPQAVRGTAQHHGAGDEFLRYLEAFTPPGEHYTNPVMITVPRYYPRPRKDRLAALRSWAVSMSNDADGKSTSTRLSAGSCAINSRRPTSPTTPSARA